MNHSFSDVKKRFTSIRYIDDKSILSQQSFYENENSIVDEFYHTSVCISPTLTPIHEGKIVEICNNLNIERDSVLAFINSSSEINAYCRQLSNDRCLINFTSGLINLFSPDEFAFIAGHEIGHFIFEHSNLSNEGNTPELFIRLRAQEISSDRIGYLCCDSIDIAASSLVKLASGLNDDYLKLDINEFLSQAENLSLKDSSLNLFETHPTVLIRVKSILWFSMHKLNIKYDLKDSDIKNLKKIDLKIKNDIDKFIDNTYKESIVKLEEKYRLWFSTAHVLRDDIFDKKEQKIYSKIFGSEKLKEIKNFLNNSNKKDVADIIEKNLLSIKSEIYNLNSSSFEEKISALENSAVSAFD
jgi:hypothetical protein